MQRAMKHRLGAMVIGGLFTTLSLTSCGGGGDSGTSTPPVGTPTSVVTSGTITGFGSVFVNDRKFEINDSTKTTKDDLIYNGDASAKLVLREGMVVTVSGTSSGTTRTAATIVHHNTLEGPIESKNQIDVTNGTLVVLGQTVIVDDTTRFESGLSLGNLAAGHVIELSGFVRGDGIIQASFIERKAISGACSLECEVKGTVKNHNHAATTFQIGTLIVNYGSALIDNSLPAPSGNNWNNLSVEAKGTNLTAGVLTASKVEAEGFQAQTGNQVELEAFVTSISGMPTSFLLGTTTVQVTAGTLYLGGVIGDIAVGQKLEVQGSISGGVITATKVKFQDAVRIESNVFSKPTATSFTVDGLPGITVVVNSQTQFKNAANLGAIPVGSNVRIQGREAAGNSVVATEVELRSTNPDNKVILQGVVQSVSNPQLTILGVLIDSTTVSQFRDINDQSIIRTEFFTALKPNTTVVKAKADLFGLSVTWKEMELESD